LDGDASWLHWILRCGSWVRAVLHEGKLKLVVLSSSLDLGVRFQPVDRVVQIGSPKGGFSRLSACPVELALSQDCPQRSFFVPTNALETDRKLPPLRDAIENQENWKSSVSVSPWTYDVLIQFLVTLAVGWRLIGACLTRVAKRTSNFSANSAKRKWLDWIDFITKGGINAGSYEDFLKGQLYRKMGYSESPINGLHEAPSCQWGRCLDVCSSRFKNGGIPRNVEEYFISKMKNWRSILFLLGNLESCSGQRMSGFVKVSWKESNECRKLDGCPNVNFSSKLAEKIQENCWRITIKGSWSPREIDGVLRS